MNAISDVTPTRGHAAFSVLDPAARGLFDADIAVKLRDPRAPLGGLLSPETTGMTRMVDKRQREFTAGRIAAHRAMADLGVPVRPVLPGADRAPVWPEGLVGSLSHCKSLCICALGHAERVRALGVDVEEDTPLEPEMIAMICTPPEQAWLDRQGEALRGHLAKLIFTAKETTYKAQYPITREILDFDAIAVEPDLERMTFAATFLHAVGPFACGTRMGGRFARSAGLVMSGMTLRPPAHG